MLKKISKVVLLCVVFMCFFVNGCEESFTTSEMNALYPAYSEHVADKLLKSHEEITREDLKDYYIKHPAEAKQFIYNFRNNKINKNDYIKKYDPEDYNDN